MHTQFNLDPVLRMLCHFYSQFPVLRQSDLPPSRQIDDDEASELIDNFSSESHMMSLQLGIVEKVIAGIEVDESNRRTNALHNVYRLIMNVVNGAGIIGDSYSRWLEQVKAEALSFAYREAEDATLMLKELQFHMKRLTRMLHIYAKNNCKDKEVQSLIAKSLKELNQLKATLMKAPEAVG